MAASDGWVTVGRFGAPHGVRGEVRLKTFTADPASVTAYGPLQARDGRRFEIETMRPAAGTSHDMLVVRVRGVDDRTGAESLNGVELLVPRDRLPPPDDEDDFYHADLIGLAAETVAGDDLGRVAAIHNHGAGDIVEIAVEGGAPLLLPFTRAVVPIVDIPGGRIVVTPPEEVSGESEAEA